MFPLRSSFCGTDVESYNMIFNFVLNITFSSIFFCNCYRTIHKMILLEHSIPHISTHYVILLNRGMKRKYFTNNYKIKFLIVLVICHCFNFLSSNFFDENKILCNIFVQNFFIADLSLHSNNCYSIINTYKLTKLLKKFKNVTSSFWKSNKCPECSGFKRYCRKQQGT